MDTNQTPKMFYAVANGFTLVTIQTFSEESARGIAESELSKPGRGRDLHQWQLFGSQIVQEVMILGICTLIDELGIGYGDYMEYSDVIMGWIADNNAHYYARPREDFSEWEAVREARLQDKSLVVVEDLS